MWKKIVSNARNSFESVYGSQISHNTQLCPLGQCLSKASAMKETIPCGCTVRGKEREESLEEMDVENELQLNNSVRSVISSVTMCGLDTRKGECLQKQA